MSVNLCTNCGQPVTFNEQLKAYECRKCNYAVLVPEPALSEEQIAAVEERERELEEYRQLQLQMDAIANMPWERPIRPGPSETFIRSEGGKHIDEPDYPSEEG